MIANKTFLYRLSPLAVAIALSACSQAPVATTPMVNQQAIYATPVPAQAPVRTLASLDQVKVSIIQEPQFEDATERLNKIKPQSALALLTQSEQNNQPDPNSLDSQINSKLEEALYNRLKIQFYCA